MVRNVGAGVGVDLAAWLRVNATDNVPGDTGSTGGMMALQTIIVADKAGLGFGLLLQHVKDCAKRGVGRRNFEVVSTLHPANVSVVVEEDCARRRGEDER